MAKIYWTFDRRRFMIFLRVSPNSTEEEKELKKWILARKAEEPKRAHDRRHTFKYRTKRNDYSYNNYYEIWFDDEHEATAFKITWLT